MSDLVPSEIFSKHLKNFLPLRPILLNLYKNYPNKSRIITLLDYWIFSIFSLKEVYGQDGLLKFCNSNFDNPQRFSFEYEFSNFRVGPQLNNSRNNPIKFYLLNYFISKFYIPGAPLIGLTSKLLNRISLHCIRSIPVKEDSIIKFEVLKLIDEILSPFFSILEMESIRLKLPPFFYSEVVHVPHKPNILIKGSCAAFLEFAGIEKLLLFNRELKIEGFQHGGGYDIFKIDHFADYEKQLSNIFFGWGFSTCNKPQKKFKRLRKSKKIKKVESRILWIEDSAIPSFYFSSMPYHHFQTINKETKSYIYKELNENNLNYSSLYHPASKSDLYKNYRKDDYLLSGRGPSENIISPKDILIFDNSGSTLIHFAIENDIIFYNVISRSDFDRFTPLQQKFFLLLKKNNLGFYSDEKGKLSKSILRIVSDKKYTLPSGLLNFNKNIFKSG